MFRSAVRPFARRAARTIFSVACVAGLAIAGSAAYAQNLFQQPLPTLSTGVGTTPVAVAAADFARSGFQSMAVADSKGKNINVYLATGPASFASGVTYSACNGVPTNTGPTGILAADVNNDGYPDLIVACSGTIDLFLNAGNGTFSESNTFTVAGTSAMVVGNFSNNNVADLAVVRSGGITVFTNVGGANGTITIALSGTLTGIVTGDFNHDGNLDLAVSDSANNKVDVLTGNGTGNFSLLGGYSTGNGTKPSGLVAADFNHDGNLDVATSNAGTNTATILLGSATGALTAQTAQATGANPIAISVADVNSDGDPDLVVFDSPTTSTGEVDVLLGNGNGTLQTAQAASQTFVPGTLAAVADFNQDGKPDLALTQQNTNQVSLMLNNTLPTQYPDGRSYSAYRTLTNGYGNMADSVATGDFNKDGKLDIAVTYLEDNVVRVLTNNGNGFNTAVAYAVGQQPYWVASADLNGDGYPDLVTANTTPNAATGTVSVLLNNKNGTFASAVNYTVGKDPYQVAIGDLNNDGIPYLAVANYASNTVTVLKGSTAGTFTTLTTLSTCANPYGVAIGDFKHNGFPSIAVTCYMAAQAEVFPNNGNGTFGTPVVLTTNTNPGSLVVGDFNRDGNLDIVVANSTANNVSFFAGSGNNKFAAGVTSPSLNFPATIAAGDVNGDGILDIVGVAPNFNDVVVTLGVGDGTFGTFNQRSAGEFPAAKQPWGLALGDFNNDGQLDIVTANTYNQINIAQPAYQQRYMAEFPAVPAGNPSIDILTNTSAVKTTVSVAPPNNTSPIPNNNTNVTLQASVQPAISGSTPTGSVIFELQEPDGTVELGTGPLTGGNASFDAGHLDAGSYQFTSLYSGDSNFQPATAVPLAITVAATAVVPPNGNACNGTYTGTFNGNITVSPGQNCTFISGGVSGNVTENGGNLTLTNSKVGGNVTVNSGTFTIGPGSTVDGNVTIQNVPTSSGQNKICGTKVDGNLTFQNSGTAVLIGDPAACAGNIISGNLTDQNNTAATTLDGNTVSGNLDDHNNTAATMVFTNKIGGNLTCQLNTSITGGGNTAASKQGQCATF
jgi:cytoskeletal protein CcmA (bactofilin family)